MEKTNLKGYLESSPAVKNLLLYFLPALCVIYLLLAFLAECGIHSPVFSGAMDIALSISAFFDGVFRIYALKTGTDFRRNEKQSWGDSRFQLYLGIVIDFCLCATFFYRIFI